MKVFTPNPALGRWRQGYHKFKVILCYTVISRLLEILSYKGGAVMRKKEDWRIGILGRITWEKI